LLAQDIVRWVLVIIIVAYWASQLLPR